MASCSRSIAKRRPRAAGGRIRARTSARAHRPGLCVAGRSWVGGPLMQGGGLVGFVRAAPPACAVRCGHRTSVQSASHGACLLQTSMLACHWAPRGGDPQMMHLSRPMVAAQAQLLGSTGSSRSGRCARPTWRGARRWSPRRGPSGPSSGCLFTRLEPRFYEDFWRSRSRPGTGAHSSSVSHLERPAASRLPTARRWNPRQPDDALPSSTTIQTRQLRRAAAQRPERGTQNRLQRSLPCTCMPRIWEEGRRREAGGLLNWLLPSAAPARAHACHQPGSTPPLETMQLAASLVDILLVSHTPFMWGPGRHPPWGPGRLPWPITRAPSRNAHA